MLIEGKNSKGYLKHLFLKCLLDNLYWVVKSFCVFLICSNLFTAMVSKLIKP